MRVLVVDDEPAISAALERGLLAEGLDVDVAADGESALWRAREGDYGVIILDILLPDRSGYEVCEILRGERITTPILMLTAKSGEYDETKGLNIGADDFLRKPFSFKVLVARIRALMRRQQAAQFGTLTRGDLHYNPMTRECWFAGTLVDLTSREAAVLELLLRAQGDVVSREALLNQVWGMDFDGDPNIVDVYIGYLRRKIDKPHGRKVLITVRGLGYRVVGADV
ncbi:MAG: response regulator transcription factor [Gammaproteobacteria bacterium]